MFTTEMVMERIDSNLGLVVNYSRRQWDMMLLYAQVHDIDKGGTYDGRLVAINIWCTQDDCPTGHQFRDESHRLDYISTIYYTNHGIQLDRSYIHLSKTRQRWIAEKVATLLNRGLGPDLCRKYNDMIRNNIRRPHIIIKPTIVRREMRGNDLWEDSLQPEDPWVDGRPIR